MRGPVFVENVCQTSIRPFKAPVFLENFWKICLLKTSVFLRPRKNLQSIEDLQRTIEWPYQEKSLKTSR